MVSKRLEEASKLVDEALKEVYSDTTITSILMKCKMISKLMDIEHENKWLDYEINGYPLADDSRGSTKQHSSLPQFRCLNLIAKIASGRADSYSNWSSYKPRTPFETTFWVTESCGFLESLREMTVKKTLVLKKGSYTFKYLLYSEVGKARINGILSALRIKLSEFLMEQKIRLSFSPLVEHIFEGTKKLVIDTLSDIDSDLLDVIIDTLTVQQEEGNELDWQSTADSCRSIIERFTELLMTNQIVSTPEEKPEEADAVGKLSLVILFVRKKLTKKKSKKYEKLAEAGLDYLFNYFQSLKAIIQKVRHKPTASENKILKDEADRAVAYVLLWIADMIRLLNRAGFDWSKSRELVSQGGKIGEEK